MAPLPTEPSKIKERRLVTMEIPRELIGEISPAPLMGGMPPEPKAKKGKQADLL
jgi:hypothetical protein